MFYLLAVVDDQLNEAFLHASHTDANEECWGEKPFNKKVSTINCTFWEQRRTIASLIRKQRTYSSKYTVYIQSYFRPSSLAESFAPS